MIRSLRRRLILSHVLPLLIIIPLIGLALVYVLESQVVIPNLALEVSDEARLIADLASSQPAIWTSPETAQVFVTSMQRYVSERIMLFDTSGRLLASSSPDDADRVGMVITMPGMAEALSDNMSVHAQYSQGLSTDIVDVFTTVRAPDGKLLGVVRLSHSLSSVYDRFVHQRYLIAAVLVLGLLIGGTVGWLLALDIERPVREVTEAVLLLMSGQDVRHVPEEGPEEVRALARSFNSLVERLAGLEQARRQLLANLVHELGRPLGALHSAIEALVGGADEQPELRRELLLGMDGEVARLRRLLDDLARLRDELVGTLELNLRPLAMSDWLSQVLAPWQQAAQHKGLHWQSAIPLDLPTISIDPDRLGQALGNLVSNAIRYTPSGGQITVAAGYQDAWLWIRVSDTGPGIPPEEQEHVFIPFYRSHPGRRFAPGMGLGLSIARSLVTAHGGRLELHSTPGHGSDFTIWIPAT